MSLYGLIFFLSLNKIYLYGVISFNPFMNFEAYFEDFW